MIGAFPQISDHLALVYIACAPTSTPGVCKHGFMALVLLWVERQGEGSLLFRFGNQTSLAEREPDMFEF